MKKGEESRRLGEVLSLLAGLRGVKNAFILTPETKLGLEEIEKKYPSLGPLTIENTGVRECLRRDHVVCIIKDRTFRAPPQPTVVLVNDEGAIVGREVFDGEKVTPPPGKGSLFLGKGFVVFYSRGSGKGARFVLPPVPFEELEGLDFTDKVTSCSPSTVGDRFLRQKAGLEDDPELASILVGFDLC
ncbi:MAG: hypothetical protein MUC90_05140 [Thermoplasmata archaeon]|jgi:hypothetical protein|nr:hypothetical protein [Thermoplasmata archaeon]